MHIFLKLRGYLEDQTIIEVLECLIENEWMIRNISLIKNELW